MKYLKYLGQEPENVTYLKGVQLNHYPDSTKSRSSYLPLLELSVAENPNDGSQYTLFRKRVFFSSSV